MSETNTPFTLDEKNEDLIDDLDLNSKIKDDSLKEKSNDEEKEILSQDSNDGLVIGKTKIILMKKLLENIKENNERLIEILSQTLGVENEEQIGISQIGDINIENKSETKGEGKIIEGVFDGENMIGPDGKQYSVPANYASKSKLIEGDILKLTITSKGVFVYKQIGPIERIRAIGRLEQDENNNYLIVTEAKKYHVLTASVSYFKGQVGDEVVILIPKAGESKWAAVENIVKKSF